MDISLFPKGKYIAKKENLVVKSKNTKAYMLELVDPKNNRCTPWDASSFRPDISKITPNDKDAVVLYENIFTCKCCKIPRYIYIQDKWFVNVR